MAPKPVIIAGGGIGGLVTALTLEQIGVPSVVFEAVREMRPLGVGINLQPNAVRELGDLGFSEADLDRVGLPAQEWALVGLNGADIYSEPRGRGAGYNWPQYAVHRGLFHMMLYDRVVARLGAGAVKLGARVAGYANNPDGSVTAHVEHADGSTSQAEGALLIGADGIHSAIRAQLFPDEGPPQWNGVQMWRGVTEGKPFLDGRSLVWAGWNRQKFVCYPISKKLAGDGRALINWIADLRFDDRVLPRREDWNRPGRLEDFLPRYESWKWPFLDVPDVIRNARAVYEFPMVDRDPLDHWAYGRVALLGDAAHPMYPIGSNGASQAILDAEAIADSLAAIPDPQAALRDYEAKRQPMAAGIVHMNRQQGIDVILDIVEERAPDGFARIDDVVPRAELESIVARYKQVAGHRQK